MRKTFNGLGGRRYYYPGYFAGGAVGGCFGIILSCFALVGVFIVFWVLSFF